MEAVERDGLDYVGTEPVAFHPALPAFVASRFKAGHDRPESAAPFMLSVTR